MESYDIQPMNAEVGPCVDCGKQGKVMMRGEWYCYDCANKLK